MYKLVIQDDEGKTTVVPLIRDELTIGRKEGNTIRLTERNVSRRHARLVRQNGSITIEDLNSYNGIRVNGSRIQGRCQIRETDRVQIGDYLIELKSETHDKADTLSERTIPLERIDPHATTPVPDALEPNDSAVATTRMSKTDAASILGSSFVGPVTEAMAPLSDTDPSGAPPGAAPPPPPVAPGVAGPPPSQVSVTPPVAPVAHSVAHARLVVLSTSFAGREFELDKPAMVVGRTEDNDVCLNHRSISRHHAKVVRENGRHAIVDLQSSNGVRVNGEEYGKVELRRADVIDLGHVRLRFVEAGEDFLFGRDAQAVDVVVRGSSRLAMWFALGLLAVGAAVILFLILGGGGDGSGDEGGGGAEAASSAGQSSVGQAGGSETPSGGAPSGGASTVSAAPAGNSGSPAAAAGSGDSGGSSAGSSHTESPSPEASDEVTKLLDSARKAVDAEKWNDVLTAAKSALEMDPSNRAAQSLVEQAQNELNNEQIHRQFQRAVGIRDYAKVAELYRRLDPESVYRVKAQADHDRLRSDFVKLHGREGKRLADHGKCRDQEKLANEVGRVWPEASRTVMNYPCSKQPGTGPVAGANGGAGAAPAGGAPVGEAGGAAAGGGESGGGEPVGAGTPSGATPAVPAGGSFEQLLDQTRSAMMAGQYAKSLRFCEMAAEKKPSDQQAASLCGMAACRLKSSAKARRFIRKINSATRQQQVQQICLQEGVTDI